MENEKLSPNTSTEDSSKLESVSAQTERVAYDAVHFEPAEKTPAVSDPWVGVRKGQCYDMPTPAAFKRGVGGDE